MTPTQRTLKALRDEGFTATVCERWVKAPYLPGGGHRKDLFGIFDIVAIHPERKMIVGVQCCGQDFAAHKRKIEESPNSKLWVDSGGMIQLWGWRKIKKKRGGKQMVWAPRVEYWDGFGNFTVKKDMPRQKKF